MSIKFTPIGIVGAETATKEELMEALKTTDINEQGSYWCMADAVRFILDGTTKVATRLIIKQLSTTLNVCQNYIATLCRLSKAFPISIRVEGVSVRYAISSYFKLRNKPDDVKAACLKTIVALRTKMSDRALRRLIKESVDVADNGTFLTAEEAKAINDTSSNKEAAPKNAHIVISMANTVEKLSKSISWPKESATDLTTMASAIDAIMPKVQELALACSFRGLFRKA